MNRRLAFEPSRGLWLLVLLVVGCGRAPVVIPQQPVDAYTFRQTQGEIRVALEPFFTARRARGSFSGGEEFPERGLLPVQVIIENGSPEEIRVSPGDFRLLRPNAAAEAPLSPYDAFAMVKIPVGWWALGTGMVGGSVPAYRNEARRKDIESRALGELTIPPGQSATGFLYFAIAENEVNLGGNRIVFLVKRQSGRDLLYEIAIGGRRDIPETPRRAEPAGPSSPIPQAPTRTEGAGGGVIIRSPGP